jgi:hypothetical protein
LFFGAVFAAALAAGTHTSSMASAAITAANADIRNLGTSWHT